MRPNDPGSTLAQSDRISPNMFSVTHTSNADGFCMTCMHALSTYLRRVSNITMHNEVRNTSTSRASLVWKRVGWMRVCLCGRVKAVT